MNKPSNYLPGQVLILALILLVVVMIISTAMFSQMTTFLHSGSQAVKWEQATVIADAGADNALYQLNQTSGSYTGTGAGCVGAIPLGTGQITIDVQQPSPSIRKITSTGYIPTCANQKVKRVVKVEVSQAASVKTIDAGANHTCAVLNTGAAKCWGDNGGFFAFAFGQLGDGNSPIDSAVPVNVFGIDNITNKAIDISAGGAHTCAVLNTGAAKCWGININGRLGDGAGNPSDTPVDAFGIDGVTSSAKAISAGNSHTCAILTTGAAKCWGRNSTEGKLGDGTQFRQERPVGVVGIDGTTADRKAKAISAGNSHTCAILETGAAKCWGANSEGQLGNDNSPSASLTPVNVVGIDGIANKAIGISAGQNHSCVALTTKAQCWGQRDNGQLGDGSFSGQSDIPVDVINLTDTSNPSSPWQIRRGTYKITVD